MIQGRPGRLNTFLQTRGRGNGGSGGGWGMVRWGWGQGDYLSQESLVGSCLVIEAPTQSVSLSSGLDACCRQTKG